jgi:hypothetical protein
VQVWRSGIEAGLHYQRPLLLMALGQSLQQLRPFRQIDGPSRQDLDLFFGGGNGVWLGHRGLPPVWS